MRLKGAGTGWQETDDKWRVGEKGAKQLQTEYTQEKNDNYTWRAFIVSSGTLHERYKNFSEPSSQYLDRGCKEYIFWKNTVEKWNANPLRLRYSTASIKHKWRHAPRSSKAAAANDEGPQAMNRSDEETVIWLAVVITANFPNKKAWWYLPGSGGWKSRSDCRRYT